MLGKAVLWAGLVASAGSVDPAQAAERGQAQAVLHGRPVVVDYGRVELKGRRIETLLAQLPEDRVWRAGADEITTLTTDIDLFVNPLRGASCSRVRTPGKPKRIPAGRYSLYVSIPREGDWLLIFNADLGIELGALGEFMGFAVPAAEAGRRWPHLQGYNLNIPAGVMGIAHMELARVPMQPGRLEFPVDPFTISLEPSGTGALSLTLAWEHSSWSVELTAGEPATAAAR